MLDDGARRFRRVHDERVCRLLQSLELALQQIGLPEVVFPIVQTRANQRCGRFQVHPSDPNAAGKYLSVFLFECRTTQDEILAAIDGIPHPIVDR